MKEIEMNPDPINPPKPLLKRMDKLEQEVLKDIEELGGLLK